MATETSSIDELLSQNLAPPQVQKEVEPEIEAEFNEYEGSDNSADNADIADEQHEEEKDYVYVFHVHKWAYCCGTIRRPFHDCIIANEHDRRMSKSCREW